MIAGILAALRAIPAFAGILKFFVDWFREYSQKKHEVEALQRKETKLDEIREAMHPAPPAPVPPSPPVGGGSSVSVFPPEPPSQ